MFNTQQKITSYIHSRAIKIFSIAILSTIYFWSSSFFSGTSQPGGKCFGAGGGRINPVYTQIIVDHIKKPITPTGSNSDNLQLSLNKLTAAELYDMDVNVSGTINIDNSSLPLSGNVHINRYSDLPSDEWMPYVTIPLQSNGFIRGGKYSFKVTLNFRIGESSTITTNSTFCSGTI